MKCAKCYGTMYSERSIERGVCLGCEDFDYGELPELPSFGACPDDRDIEVELGEER